MPVGKNQKDLKLLRFLGIPLRENTCKICTKQEQLLFLGLVRKPFLNMSLNIIWLQNTYKNGILETGMCRVLWGNCRYLSPKHHHWRQRMNVLVHLRMRPYKYRAQRINMPTSSQIISSSQIVLPKQGQKDKKADNKAYIKRQHKHNGQWIKMNWAQFFLNHGLSGYMWLWKHSVVLLETLSANKRNVYGAQAGSSGIWSPSGPYRDSHKDYVDCWRLLQGNGKLKDSRSYEAQEVEESASVSQEW